MKIYCKLEKKPRIKDFIRSGFKPEFFGTVKFVETYLDKECTIPQCHSARRSFEDLLDIVKTVYPNATKKRVAKVLCELNDSKELTCIYCEDIHKTVFFKYGNAVNNYVFGDRHLLMVGGAKWANEKGKSKYSINDVLELAGRPKK